MNKLLSIFFALVLFSEALMPNMDMCEFIKIPNLIEHYLELQNSDQTSVLDFLASHYGNSQKDPGHHNDTHDENLPFQGKACCQTLLFFPEQINFSCKVPSLALHEKTPYNSVPVASGYLGSIFQPPKQA